MALQAPPRLPLAEHFEYNKCSPGRHNGLTRLNGARCYAVPNPSLYRGQAFLKHLKTRGGSRSVTDRMQYAGLRLQRSNLGIRQEGCAFGRCLSPANKRPYATMLSGLLDQISAAFTSMASAASEVQKDLVEGAYVVGDCYGGDEDIVILAHERTPYNEIVVLEVARRAEHSLAGSRVLLLDAPGNIHSLHNPFQVNQCFDSIYEPDKVWTDSYYDVFATLPPLLPEGPVALLGLAGGTAARLLLHAWPWLEVHGWELDPAVVRVAREFFALRELEGSCEEADLEEESGRVTAAASRGAPAAGIQEPGRERALRSPSAVDLASMSRRSEESASASAGWGGRGMGSLDMAMAAAGVDGGSRQSGRLVVHIGNALSADASIVGGFSAILVDLFADGVVIPELQEVDTWRSLRKRLRPGGRIMVNCGAGCVQGSGEEGQQKDGELLMRETVAALAEACHGEVWWQRVDGEIDGNVMALTGPFPDLGIWLESLPEYLGDYLQGWRAVEELLRKGS